MSFRAPTLVLWLAATSAWAWPVDWVHDVEAGKEKFVKLPALDFFVVDDESVAKAEWFGATNEFVIDGVKAGRTLMVLGAEGKIAAWRIRVGGKALIDDQRCSAARAACGEANFKATPLDPTVKLSVAVKSEACRRALLSLFQTDAYDARQVELTFDASVLQAQLKVLEAAMATIAGGKVTARYVGAGLVLESKEPITRDEYHRTLWAVLNNTVGRFALDEHLAVK